MEKLRRNTKRAQKVIRQSRPDTTEFDLPKSALANRTALGESFRRGRQVRTNSAYRGQNPEPEQTPARPAALPPENRDDELDLVFTPAAPAGPPVPAVQENFDEPQKIVSLVELHRQRRHRKLRRLALAILLVAAALVWLAGTYGDNLAVLGDWLDNLSVITNRNGSFPTKTGISEPQQLLALSDGFVELGQTDLLVYSGDGTQLRSLQHGYGRPVITAGNTRFCVYNRAGNELKVESRTKNLYTFGTDDPILLCSMSRNGTLAVVTKAPRTSARLQVYSNTMALRWAWNASDQGGVPVSIAFASDNHRMAVGCLEAVEGALQTQLYFLDVNRDDIPAQYTAQGTLVRAEWITGSRLLAVYEDRAEVIDAAEGTLVAGWDFGGMNLQGVDTANGRTALLMTSRAGSRIVVLDSDLAQVCGVETSDTARGVTLARNALYVRYDNAVETFDLTGLSKWRSTYSAKVVAVMDLKRLLVFSGNTVRIPEETNEAVSDAVSRAASSSQAESEAVSQAESGSETETLHE